MTSPEIDLFCNLYSEGRKTLIKDAQHLDSQAFDWRGLNSESVVTIGSNIVHILGFADIVRHALSGEDLAEVHQSKEWQERYWPGFPRELNQEPPSGYNSDYYIDLIQKETKQTLDFVQNHTLPQEVIFYENGKEFQSEALVAHNGLRLLFYIPIHDSYHSGQITQQKYNYRSLKSLAK